MPDANPAGTQQGVEVVHPYYKITKGLPAAIVRSYKQPLYDAEQILAATPTQERILFQKPLGQFLADGVTVKTTLFTNMGTAGQLGNPLSYDIYGFNARLETPTTRTISKGNFDAFYSSAVAQVVFSTDTPFLTVPLEEVPEGAAPEGFGTTDSPHIAVGFLENIYRFDVGGRSLHINSTESFSVKIQFPSGGAGITGNHIVRWYYRGILYKGV